MMAAIGILTETLSISPFAAIVMLCIVAAWAFALVWWTCTGFWKLVGFGIKTVVVFAFIAFTLGVMALTWKFVSAFLGALLA